MVTPSPTAPRPSSTDADPRREGRHPRAGGGGQLLQLGVVGLVALAGEHQLPRGHVRTKSDLMNPPTWWRNGGPGGPSYCPSRTHGHSAAISAPSSAMKDTT